MFRNSDQFFDQDTDLVTGNTFGMIITTLFGSTFRYDYFIYPEVSKARKSAVHVGLEMRWVLGPPGACRPV